MLMMRLHWRNVLEDAISQRSLSNLRGETPENRTIFLRAVTVLTAVEDAFSSMNFFESSMNSILHLSPKPSVYPVEMRSSA